MRDSILRAVVLVGTATLFITELLSPFHLLTRWPLAAAWLVAMAAWLRFGPRVNASARYIKADALPCAVWCPDCIGNQPKVALYREIGPPIEIGRFLLF